MPTDEEYLKELEVNTPPPSGEGQTIEEALGLSIAGQEVKVPLGTEFPITHNGQSLKVPLSKVLNGYRQAQNLEDQWSKFKKDRESFETERGSVDEFKKRQESLQPYVQLQQWSEELEKSNPIGYQKLMATIDALKNGSVDDNQGLESSVNPVIKGLRSQLDELSTWKKTWEEKETQAEQERLWKVVQEDIGSFKKEYPEIDLDGSDETGTKLYARIIDWGRVNGYQDFTPAAYAFLKDQLRDTLTQRARNEAVKGIRKDKSDGIMARSSTPFPSSNGQGTKVDPKRLSYDDLASMALDELAGT